VTRTGAIGVDVERLQPCGSFDRIAERFFSLPEIQALRALPPHLRRDEFLAYWTRKEAFAKALGMGLQMDWVSFDVSRVPAQAGQSYEPGGNRWSIHTFRPALGYVGALAHEASCPILKFWKWLPLAPATRLIEPAEARVSSNNHVVDLMSKEEISV
jgi:4'-phosphopantetheinyl transferase